jgi:hypothetical protein
MSSYKLHDGTIGLLAQLLQIALLTGTDIVDHFRTLQLIDDGNGKLIPDPAFKDQFEANLQRMLDEVAKIAEDSTEEVPSEA